MSQYEYLPIYKKMFDIVVYIEKIIKKGEKHFARFQISFEKKYAALAVKSGYNVYVINQAADVFAHNLRVRVLTKGYNCDKPTVIRKSIPIFF